MKNRLFALILGSVMLSPVFASANSLELLSCSVQPKFVASSDDIRIELIYTANVKNISQRFIKEAGVSWAYGNSPIDYSTNTTINLAPEDSGGIWQNVQFWYQKDILPEDLSGQRDIAQNLFNGLMDFISSGELSCKV